MGERKIGELAEAAGVTIRTLHYYEEIDLLVASNRTAAGHRLYSDDDVERLYRICLLRRLGLPLADVARALDDPAWNLRSAMAAHLSELERRIDAEGRLRGRLARLVAAAADPGNEPIGSDLLEVLEEMTMLDTIVQRRISTLVYEDLEAAHDYLIRVFGLGPGELTRNGDGNVVHGEIEAGDGLLWLHPEAAHLGLQSPKTLGGSTATMVIMVDDVDAHYRHAVSEGAKIRYEPVDQPYGYREYGAHDLEGGLWSFMKALG